MIALCLNTTFTSCNPTPIAEQVTHATEGEDGDVIPDPDEDENP